MPRLRFATFLFTFCITLHLAASDVTLPPLQEPLGGTLIIHGGGSISQKVRSAFIAAAGGAEARIVVIPTATENPFAITVENRLAFWGAIQPKELQLLHAPTRKEAEIPTFSALLKTATGVWIEGGQQSRLEERYTGTPVEAELHALLKRGGVIGGTSAGAAILSRTMIRKGDPEMGRGLGFLTNIVVDQHFTQRQRSARLVKAVTELTRGHAGLGIDEDTAAIVRDRYLFVEGEGAVTLLLPPSAQRPAKQIELRSKGRADLLAVSRAALARAGESFPPSETPVPEVPPKGLLVIGGSGISREGTQRFIQHAGGAQARIVIISTALDDTPPAEPYEVKALERLGVKNVKVVHAKTRAEAESPTVLDPIRNATGLWFSGGRQWRLVDKYLGTSAEREMHALLARGGTIAGGSAGATIQGDFLVRGNPLGNVEMMVEGYERGLGFLKGVAIDQHFTQRNRFADMTLFKQAVPHYLGIGLDEDTALVVSGHIAEIVGTHSAAFYDKPHPLPAGTKEYTSLKAGEKYDLKARKKVE